MEKQIKLMVYAMFVTVGVIAGFLLSLIGIEVFDPDYQAAFSLIVTLMGGFAGLVFAKLSWIETKTEDNK